MVGMISTVGMWIYRHEFGVVRREEAVAVEAIEETSPPRVAAAARS